ncbi:MAG: cupin domain-containing protein [Ornithinimicrobium sp.]|uniref:cupin domain-containing protein n=1 Tax=Ornithinimicrobium sp. TaxID=1977084 RepID=UPI0026DFBD14|nr:cupin domain-containing protein [Ornithinimicrobium sp.]MDO5739034.1 cupin domain-containing protein [Ornithinimicrobium sp.]
MTEKKTKRDYTTGKDHGKKPYVLDIEKETLGNDNFRRTLWTGEHLQLTLMSIDVGDDIGLEVHEGNDQFLRVESGKGRTQMGPSEDDLPFVRDVEDDDIVMVPAGTWHNVTNTGDEPLKVYVLYGPPDHEPGTVHRTHQDAEKDPNED